MVIQGQGHPAVGHWCHAPDARRGLGKAIELAPESVGTLSIFETTAQHKQATEIARISIAAAGMDFHQPEPLEPVQLSWGGNVTLVDIRSNPIEEITSTGLRTADTDYALDAIVFATGFDAMTGAMKEVDIHTDAGVSISQKWEHGPRTYLGIMIAGFPNLFMITGPQSPGVKSQMILACEQHVDWIADCMQYLRGHGFSRIEAEQDAEDAWVQHNNEVADRTLYPLANSWYVGANIPGKHRVFMPYVGGVTAYKKKCDEIAASGYEGFLMDMLVEEQRFAAD